MVPQGQDGDKERKGHKAARGSSGKDDRSELFAEPLAEIDPDLAVVIKHRLRVQIIAIAHQRPISPSEFSEESGCTLKQASDHFQALTKADFLELVDRVNVRGTVRHMYRATRRAYVSAADWSQLGKPVLEEMGAEILRDFNARVNDAMDAGTFYNRPNTVLAWLALMLDDVSWPEFIDVLVWGYKEVKRFEVETAERRANGEDHGCIPVTFGIAGFESPKESERKGKGTGKSERARKPKPAQGKGEAKRKAPNSKGTTKRKAKASRA